MFLSAELVLGAVLLSLLAFGVGRCHAPRDSVDHAESAYRMALVARANRIAHTDSVIQVRTIYRDRIVEANDSVLSALARADSALADSAATTAELRLALRDLVDRSESLAVRVPLLVAVGDSLVAVVLQEREAHRIALAHADSVIAQYKAKAECRVLGIPCPSRTIAFGGGMVTALLLVLLL